MGSGTSSYVNGNIEVRLNYSTDNSLNGLGGSTNPPYSPGTVTIQTAGPASVLALGNSIKQYDPGSGETNVNNEHGNAIKTGPNSYASDPNKVVTIHVTGGGRVVLQDGGVSSNTTFGGEWSVDSGVLQIGPYQTPFNGWSPTGQLLNALGFKTLDGQTDNGSGIQGDPDMPNGVTVHSGGMFAVAVDQVNTNSAITTQHAAQPVNSTPDYLRNPITLSGGTLSATGYEVADFNADYADYFTQSTTPVTAKLGGNFTVTPGTSTIATYNVIGGTGAAHGPASSGGSRTLVNATAAFAAGAR